MQAASAHLYHVSLNITVFDNNLTPRACSGQCQTIGGSMGLTQACPNRSDNSCQVSCQDPSVPNQCRILSAVLIDGSPCGKS